MAKKRIYKVEVVGSRGRKQVVSGDLRKLAILFSYDLKAGHRFNKDIDTNPDTPEDFIRNLNMAYGQFKDYSAPSCAKLVI